MNILVVDDDRDIGIMLEEMLAKLNHQCHVFQNTEDALTHFKEHKDGYDMAIIDYVMPGMKGDLLAKEIKKIKPSIRLMLLSAYLVDNKMDDIEFCLMKPISMHQLESVLKKAA